MLPYSVIGGGHYYYINALAIVDIDAEKLGGGPKVTKSKKDEGAPAQKWQATAKALSLCVCYAATSGGIATLTGTTPNLVLAQNVNL